jgi:hypothetical protein
MKKYIREMLNDLRRPKSKDFIPPIPKAPAESPMKELTPPPEAPLPTDLENQELSGDPLERVRQLDFQAQQAEERESG